MCLAMARLRSGFDWFSRRRWWRWFSSEFEALGVSNSRLASRVGVPPSRITDWLNEKRTVTPDLAFLVGTELAGMGSKTANGPIALFAAGHLIEWFQLLQQLTANADPRDLSVMVFLAVKMRGWTKWLDEDGYRVSTIAGGEYGEADPAYQDVTLSQAVRPIGAEPDDRSAPQEALASIEAFNSDPYAAGALARAWQSRNRRNEPAIPVAGPDIGKMMFAENMWRSLDASIAFVRSVPRQKIFTVTSPEGVRFQVWATPWTITRDDAFKFIAPAVVDAYKRSPLSAANRNVVA